MKLDPDHEFGRRILINAYLELDDPKEAEAVAASAPHPVSARLIQVLVYAHDYAAAAELGYEEDRLGTTQPIDSTLRIFAMRIQARADRRVRPRHRASHQVVRRQLGRQGTARRADYLDE